MTAKNRLEVWKGLTPAIAVFICVCLALCSYVAPTYNMDPLPELEKVVFDLSEEEAEELADMDETGSYTDGVYYGSGKGYNGNIKVKVTITDGKIASIEVVSSSDDQPYLRNSVNKVIPAMISGQTTNVDVYSGATFSSNGIILAVRDALSQAGGLQEEAEPLKSAVKEPVKKGETLETVEEPDLYLNGTYYGSAFGYNDDIRVEVVVKDGKIYSIKVIEHYDDQPYMKNAEKKVISAILNKQSTNVDACSGATFSSNGIIEAVRQALADAGTKDNPETSVKPPVEDDGNAGSSGSESGDSESGSNSNQPQQPETPTGPSGSEDEDSDTIYVYKDGVYNNDEAMVLCENPKQTSWAYYLSIELTITDGKISTVKESKKEGKYGAYDYSNNSYLTRAFQGIGKRKGMAAKIIEAQSTTGLDTVTGATITSDAILEATDRILAKIEKVPVAGKTPEVPDAEIPDTEKPDTGSADIGTSNAGTSDTGITDSETSKTEVPDASIPDADSTDVGMENPQKPGEDPTSQGSEEIQQTEQKDPDKDQEQVGQNPMWKKEEPVDLFGKEETKPA